MPALPRTGRRSASGYIATAVILIFCVSATALPTAQRRGERELSDRLDRPQSPGWTGRRVTRLHDMVHSGHAQLMHWFKDLVPLVDCGEQQGCISEALASISHKSDLWTIPGQRDLVSLLTGRTTFLAEVFCENSTVEAFQDALDGLPTSAPLLAVIPGRPPSRASPSWPGLTFSPRAEKSLGGVMELLRAPMEALKSRDNLTNTMALEVDVDGAWFLPGRRSESVQAIHFVGQGRIVVNPRLAAELQSNAARGIGILHTIRSATCSSSGGRSG